MMEYLDGPFGHLEKRRRQGRFPLPVDGTARARDERQRRERLRLSFPPHELRPNLRLACQCVVRGDVVVSKFEGFWGARPTLAPSAVAKTYFGELEYVLDSNSNALDDLGWRLRDLGGVVRREVAPRIARAHHRAAPRDVVHLVWLEAHQQRIRRRRVWRWRVWRWRR